MSKVNIGELKNLIKKQPKIAETLAYADCVVLTNHNTLGDFTGFMVIGSKDTTAEIIISKQKLREFALEIIDKTGGVKNVKNNYK